MRKTLGLESGDMAVTGEEVGWGVVTRTVGGASVAWGITVAMGVTVVKGVAVVKRVAVAEEVVAVGIGAHAPATVPKTMAKTSSDTKRIQVIL